MSKKTYTIRKAHISEADAIAAFQVDMALETEDFHLDLGTVKKGVYHIFNSKERGFYLVAESGGECVASTLVLYEWSDWRNGEVLWIHSVYVKPAFRRMGIFREMYEFLKKQVLEHKPWKGLRLYVDKTNLTAQQVYRALHMTDEHYQMFEWLK